MCEYIYEHMGKPVKASTLVQREKVVRCRDCERYHPELYKHINCEKFMTYVEPDGFCAWGKRREEQSSTYSTEHKVRN